MSCDYAAAPGAAVDGTNVVTVTTVFKAYTASAAFDFTDPTTEISKSITVDDINDVLADRSIGFTYGGSTSSVYSETVGCSLVNYNQGLNGQITINNTATVRGTAKSDSAQVDLNCYRLQATKNANTFFTETYNWALAKKASSTQLSFFDGDSAVVTYTLSVTKSAPVYSGQLVSGTIVISNPAPMAATLATVTDVLGNLPANVSCPAMTVAANSLLTCTYIVVTPDQVNRTNVVTATQLLNNGGQAPYVGTAIADFGAATVVKINDSIHVTDTNVSTVYPFSASGSASYTLPFTCANVQYNGLAGVKTVPNTAFVVETGANDSEVVRLDCYKLNVAKSAATSYTRTYTWTLDKSVSDTSLDLFEGETGTVNYTVDVVKTLLGESNFLVTGKITVTNPAPIAANVQSLVDAMTGPLNGTVNCGAVTSVAANSSLVCSYSAAPGDKTNRTNVATLTQKLGNGSTALYTGTAAVDFGSAQVTLVNDNAILSDPMMGQNVNLTNSGSVSYPSQVGCTDINFGVGTKVSFAQLNTALLLPYGFTDSESVSINCYRLAVSKTAVPTSTVGFDWTIEKSASPASLNLTSSQTAQVGYVVTVTKSIALQQNSVSGNIVISNPAPMAAILGSVVDAMTGNVAVAVNCGGAAQVAPNSTLNCTYNTAVPDTSSRTNTVTVTLSTSAGSRLYTATANVIFDEPATVLEQVTITDALWSNVQVVSTTTSFQYSVPADCVNVVYDSTGQSTSVLLNTATIVETGESASTEVPVTCRTILATVGNRVFVDINPDGSTPQEQANGNGLQDENAGEAGVAGIIVQIYSAIGDTLVATTTTDANGLYTITNLIPGDYYLVFINPFDSGIWTEVNVGDDPTIDSDADSSLPLPPALPPGEAARTEVFTLNPGETNLTFDAGLIGISTFGSSAVGNFVWLDKNENGIQEEGELGVPGVTVRLFRVEDVEVSGAATYAQIAEIATNELGLYAFSGLDAGFYFVEFVLPAERLFSPQHVGSDPAIDSDANVETGGTQVFFLPPFFTDDTLDAGIFVDDREVPTNLEEIDEPAAGLKIFIPITVR